MLSRFGKRILFWVVVLAILPLGLISFIVYHQGKEIIREQIYTSLHVTSDSIEAQILTLLDSKKNRTKDFASDGFIRSNLKEINEQPRNTEIIKALNLHLIKNKAPLDKDILDIFIFNKKGEPVASTNENRLKRGEVEAEFFLKGKDVLYVSTMDSVFAERHFHVASPIINHERNGLHGVIVVSFKAKAIDDILTGEFAKRHGAKTVFGDLNSKAKIYIVGADKNIVASKDAELIGRKADTELIRKTLSAKDETTAEFIGISGDTRIGASMYLKEPGWVVVASVSKKQIFAPVDNLSYIAFSLIFSGIITIISITVVFTKSITASLLEVSRAATRIALGNFGERISVKGKKDEIADLGNAFNKMAVNLQGTIKELKEREERLALLNRFYSVLIRINEAIIRFREPDELFNESCRICVDEGLFRFVWVGLVDKETSFIKPVARYGFEEGYLDNIKISTKEIPEGFGPVSTAIREERYDICNDMENDPRMEPWREEAIKRGYRSLAAFPFKTDKGVIGVFCSYVSAPNYFDGENIKLLERMTGDISYAIEFSDKEKLREQVEDEVRLLQSVTTSIAEAEDLNSAIDVATRKICDATKWIYGESWIPSPDKKNLVFGNACCCVKDTAEAMVFRKISQEYAFSSGVGLPGRVWAAKKVEWIRDVSVNGAVYIRSKAAMGAGLHAGLGVPIVENNEVLAVLVFYMSEPSKEEERHVNLVSAVAAQLGSVIRRKLAEDALRESESKYRTLLENLPQRIFRKDKDSVYISCNANYARDLNIKPEEIKGKTDYEFYPRGLAEKYRADDKKVIESGVAMDIEESYVPGGKEFYVHTVKVPLRDDGVTGVLGIFWDTTELRKAEEEKAKLEAQIRHMQKMEAVGQLSGGIAHDFNNMLTAIIGNATLIQMRVENDPKLMHYLEQILATTERAANLTSGLLAFSRKQIVDIKPVDLNEIVKCVERLLFRLIGEDVELKVALDGEPLIIRADVGQIEQVLMNLATNARDAMPAGGHLSISTKNVSVDNGFVKRHEYGRPGMYALLTVSDTGIGMDADTKEKIFEPFFTTKEVGKGTGLGLSIVYGIIKQHEGYINVYSEPGKGTTFRIYLPVIESRIEVLEAKEVHAPRGGTETILLAEDDAEVRRFVKTVLEEFGYSVIEAVDGEDAINKYTAYKDRIKLLVLDVIMPKKTGKEVYDSIIAVKPGIKTLFTSGYNEEIIHKQGILMEGLNFVSKPFIPTELLRTIRAILDK